MQLMAIKRDTQNAKSAAEPPQKPHLVIRVLSPTTRIQTTEPQEDSVDSLMESLSSANPRFANLLAEASRTLAPLALAENGGVTLTSLRMSAALTQTQLAQMIGQKQSNVSLMESGKRDNISRETMRRMCEALKCDMNTLDIALTNTTSMLDAYLSRLEAKNADCRAVDERKTA